MEVDYYTEEWATINRGLYEVLDIDLYLYIVPFEYLYIVVILLSTLITVHELMKQQQKKVKDQAHQILKRQLMYFFVVNSYEIPFKIFCLLLLQKISLLKAGTITYD